MKNIPLASPSTGVLAVDEHNYNETWALMVISKNVLFDTLSGAALLSWLVDGCLYLVKTKLYISLILYPNTQKRIKHI